MTDRGAERTFLFEAGEAAGMVGGACRGNLGSRIASVVVDSRLSSPNALFVALKGERTDGADFAWDALVRGASCVLADITHKERLSALIARPEFSQACLIYVDKPMAALQHLAREHRRRMKNLVRVGVTGSSGKTTTKECIAAILSAACQEGSVAASSGNLNSDVGLALSLFSLKESHRYGVFEMGMNRKGEMDELVSMYEPDLALITNVGTAHVGMIGSRQGIAEEKKRIFSRFDGHQIGFVWEDDDFLAFLERDVAGRMVEFGPRMTKAYGGAANLGLRGWELTLDGEKFPFPLPGKHNLVDALGAASVAKELGIGVDAIAKGLSSVRPLFGRSEVFSGRISLYRDCYNANPDSVRAVLDLCDEVDWPGRRIYVLGSMRELGIECVAEHRAIGARAQASRADRLFFFGKEMEAALDGFAAAEAGILSPGRLFHTNDIETLTAAVLSELRKGDLVVVKASRGLELERLTNAILKAGWIETQGNPGGTHAS
ncbi:MAG: UDP-N-acetylmuramoyl-tripeptide--D-alanyl-D-alanine ligase [Spirochaetes bacterium]|nr:UDP-N-acetylmuramoyl-tripeptide--D-alanyl-D-alanine ligase [Spirochaetota bacterium]